MNILDKLETGFVRRIVVEHDEDTFLDLLIVREGGAPPVALIERGPYKMARVSPADLSLPTHCSDEVLALAAVVHWSGNGWDGGDDPTAWFAEEAEVAAYLDGERQEPYVDDDVEEPYADPDAASASLDPPPALVARPRYRYILVDTHYTPTATELETCPGCGSQDVRPGHSEAFDNDGAATVFVKALRCSYCEGVVASGRTTWGPRPDHPSEPVVPPTDGLPAEAPATLWRRLMQVDDEPAAEK